MPEMRNSKKANICVLKVIVAEKARISGVLRIIQLQYELVDKVLHVVQLLGGRKDRIIDQQ